MYARPGRVARADGNAWCARHGRLPERADRRRRAGACSSSTAGSAPLARRLPRARAAAHAGAHRGARPGRAGDPLRHRHRRAPRVHARRRRRRDRPRLARRPRRGLGARSAHDVAVQGNLDPVALLAPRPRDPRRVARSSARPRAGPGTSSTSGTASCRRRRSITSRALVDAVHELSARAERAMAADAVLLIAFGGPTATGGDPAVPRERHARPADPARAPRGGGAPLRADRRPLAAERAHRSPGARRSRRAAARPRCRSTSACATGRRTSPTRCAQMATTACARALGVILAPHATEASCERYMEAVDAGARRARARARRRSSYVGTVARRIRASSSARRARSRAALATLPPALRADDAARLHGAQHPDADGGGVALRRASSTRSARAVARAPRARALAARATRAAAAARATPGSSPTSTTCSARSRADGARARRASRRSASSATTSRCSTTSTSRRARPRPALGLALRARQHRERPSALHRACWPSVVAGAPPA